MSERFENHLGLVHWVAKRYRFAAGLLDYEDLVQAGSLGLMKACERFDESRGVTFATFARHWIRHFVIRELQNQGATVRTPVHIQEQRFQRGERLRERIFSLDAPLPNSESDETWHAVTAAPSQAELGAAHDVAQLLASCNLTPKEARLLRLRFWGDETLNDAGYELGVSRERARQLEARALEKLRAAAQP